MTAFALVELAIYIISMIDSSWFTTGFCNVGVFKVTCAGLGVTKTVDNVIYPIVVPLFLLIAIAIPKIVGGYTRKYAMIFEVITTGASSACLLAIMIAVLVLNQESGNAIHQANYGAFAYIIMIVALINAALFITGLSEGLVALYDRPSKKPLATATEVDAVDV